MFVACYDNRESTPDYFVPFLGNVTNFCEINFITPGVSASAREAIGRFAPAQKEKLRFINPKDIPWFSHAVDLFDSVFKNYSTNPHEFERACFIRWFALNAATVTLQDCDYVCMLDTDFLIGMSAEKVLSLCIQESGRSDIQLIAEWDGLAPSWISPELAIMKKSFLFGFCEYLISTYFSEAMKSGLIREYFDRIGRGKNGGICDMLALAAYCREFKVNAFNLNSLVSHKLIGNLDSLNSEYVSSSDSWAISFSGTQQTLKIGDQSVPVVGTHFQGRAKALMRQAWAPNQPQMTLSSQVVNDQFELLSSNKEQARGFLGRVRSKFKRYIG